MSRPHFSLAVIPCAVALMLAPFATWALDLQQCYELALKNDRQLLAAKAKAVGESEIMPQAIGQMLPNISFSASKTAVVQDTTTGNTQIPQNSYPAENKVLSLRQPLFRPFLYSQYQQAKSELVRVDADLALEQQNLSVRLANAYFEALFAQDTLTLIEAQKQSYDAHLKAATAAFRSGTGTRTDIDESQAQYDRLLAQEIQAKQAIEATAHQLEVFIGQSANELTRLRDGGPMLDSFDPGELEAWLDRAIESNQELKSLRANVEAAKSAVGMARSSHFPTVDMVAQYSENSSDSSYNVGTEVKSRSIGVQMTVPIYAGGLVNSDIRKAQAQVDEYTERYEYAYRDAQLRVRKAYNSIKEGIATVHALEQALRSAEQMVYSNRMGVKAGTRTMLNVLDAEQQRFQTQVDLAKARYQALEGWVQLQSLVGAMDATEVTRISSLIF